MLRSSRLGTNMLAYTLAACFAVAAARAEDDWAPLFNGRDLQGWSAQLAPAVRTTPEELVRAEDGVIHFYPDDGDTRRQGQLTSDNAYSFYRLRLEYKWGQEKPARNAERNASIAMHQRDGWPGQTVCVLCTLREKRPGGLSLRGGLSAKTTIDPQTAESLVYLPIDAGGLVRPLGEPPSMGVEPRADCAVEGWNNVELVVAGGTIRCCINGEEVSYCTDLRLPGDPQPPLTSGRIALVATGSEVLFRNIEIKPIWGGPLEAPLVKQEDSLANYVQPEFELSDGYELSAAVAPPLVRFPMMACLDDEGRLYVCEAAGVNLFGDDLAIAEPNSILVLDDANGDGVYDRSRTFADRMTFPSGCVWRNGALYVSSAPYIWRLRDTDGDGSADERTQLVGSFSDSGIADSLHGPFFAPDGRLYWVHGIGGDGHEVHDADGRLVVKSEAPGIFSCWPDGSDIRKHCAGGMNNPVELDFTSSGAMIGTVNLLQNNPRDDALVQWMWGGLYPHNQRVIEGLPRTGDLLESTFSFGHVAVSGLCRLRSSHLGSEFRDSFLVTQFNTQRVVRVSFEPSGATYTGVAHDFLASPNTDVHFTDVLEDADGSVLAIDTGGWFRNGCPTSQIAKPNVFGAIYRIRRTDGSSFDDPRGDSIQWTRLAPHELVPLLDDDRFAVRERAVSKLLWHGDGALYAIQEALSSAASERARLNAVWALCRMKSPMSAACLVKALADSSPAVREAAAHAVFCRREQSAAPELSALLADESLAVRREAATALGVLEYKESIPALVNALGDKVDRLLEHAIIHAMIEINDPEQIAAGLAHSSPQVRRGALIALDQMAGGRLTREMVAPLLDTVDPVLQRTALEVVSRRPGWAAETIGLLEQWLHEPELPTERAAALRGAIVAFANEPQVQQLAADMLGESSHSAQAKLLVLEAMGRASLESTPTPWREALAAALAAEDEGIAQQAVLAVAGRVDQEYTDALTALARNLRRSPQLRVAAIGALAQSGAALDADLIALLVAQCSDDVNPIERLAAARALAAATLSDTQRRQLLPLVARAGPLVLPVLLGAFENFSDPALAMALVEALEQSPGHANLPMARVEKLFAAFPEDVRKAADKLVAHARAETASRAVLLDQMAAALDGGVGERGRALFHGNKASCAACHRAGGEGGGIGPDLSRIGEIRTRRDLLEAVVFPSVSFARGFEPVTIVTTAGITHSGVIGSETSAEVTLRTADRAEIRIPRGDIEAIEPSTLSIMPQGLDTSLTREELRDLLAFLASAKRE